jgi:predicted RNase H-like HicB family nuclease
MKAYTFKVIVEPDEDRWHAYCPALESQGGSTWGYTREEALKHIDEVVRLVVESMIAHGEPLPKNPLMKCRSPSNPASP